MLITNNVKYRGSRSVNNLWNIILKTIKVKNIDAAVTAEVTVPCVKMRINNNLLTFPISALSIRKVGFLFSVMVSPTNGRF